MFDTVLVAIDGSDPAAAALDHALDLAADTGSTLHLLSVADSNELSFTTVGGDVRDAQEEASAGYVADAVDRAEARGVPVHDRVIQGDPGEVIVEYAADRGVDLVVMGAHGRRGVSEYLLGSTTERVVAASDVPVLTVRATDDGAPYPYEGVLVPIDGGDHARAAVELGAAVATERDASLHLLFVAVGPESSVDSTLGQLSEELEQQGRDVLREAAELAREVGTADVETTIETGSVWREIRSAAADDPIDLLVMGTHGRTGFERYLLGSVTDRIVRTAPVPVLTTRADGA